MSRSPLAHVQGRQHKRPTELLKQAVEAHARGDLTTASFYCRLILSSEKKQFDALHLLGLIEFQRNQHSEAAQLIGRAIKINPRSADAHTNLALVLNVKEGPTSALKCLERALAINPNHPVALNNHGSVLTRLKRAEEALVSLDHVTKIVPDYADAHCNRGNALMELKRYDEAIHSFDRSLAINPNDPLLWHNRGNALFQLKRFDETVTSYERALAIAPRDLVVLCDFGNVLQKLERWDDAVPMFDRLLLLKPDDIAGLNNRGNCLWRLKRPLEALESYNKLLTLVPDKSEYYINRANAYCDLQRFSEALADYDEALRVDPDNPNHHWNRGLALLRTGDLKNGWRDYEWRLKKPDTMARLPKFSQPAWNGREALTGKRILLFPEQGLGDTIQFSRFTSLIARDAEEVILQVQPPLKTLLSSLSDVSHVVGLDEPLPPYDLHFPLLSLPAALNVGLEDIPTHTPGLKANPQRVEKWQSRIGLSEALTVAVAWAGNPDFIDDRNRSIGLQQISPLFEAPACFLSIQKVLRPGDAELLKSTPNVVHLGDEIQDFDDTAAIMSLVDLVISSDTSVVHLAGALDRPIWVLLQFASDWRWLVGREDCPWYPSARLFRQPQIGDWRSVIERVRIELLKWTSA
jgi:tetratricopeptide (TPR) repeat protein